MLDGKDRVGFSYVINDFKLQGMIFPTKVLGLCCPSNHRQIWSPEGKSSIVSRRGRYGAAGNRTGIPHRPLLETMLDQTRNPLTLKYPLPTGPYALCPTPPHI